MLRTCGNEEERHHPCGSVMRARRARVQKLLCGVMSCVRARGTLSCPVETFERGKKIEHRLTSASHHPPHTPHTFFLLAPSTVTKFRPVNPQAPPGAVLLR